MKLYICPQCSAFVANQKKHNASHSINAEVNAWVEVQFVEQTVVETSSTLLTEERNS